MSHTRDDKSAPEVCYKTLGEHGRGEPVGHTNPLAPSAEPVLYPSSARWTQTTSIQAVKKTSGFSHGQPSAIPPRRIALCGGGVRGVAHVGVMKALSDAGFLSHVKEVIGISAGAFFALLWILDYSVQQIEQLSLGLDFTSLRNIDPETVLAFPLTFGLDSGEGIEKLIVSVLKQKGFLADATFEQVAAKHSKHLRCYATELQTSRIREFSTSKTPKTSVKFAIRSSMSLPFFYTPMKEPDTNALLMDGGLLNNLPLVFLTDYEISETWGVFFTVGQGNSENIQPINDIMDVLRYVYDSSTIMKSLHYIEQFKDRLIIIPTSDFSALNFEETREERVELIELSYNITKKFMYYSKPAKIARRFSAS